MATAQQKVYLAGPDCFVPGAEELIQRKADMCAQFGFSADPAAPPPGTPIPPDPATLTREVFEFHAQLIRDSDFGIFHLTPFRGASADAGTVLELGLMTGLGKPAFAYSNVLGSYIDRVVPRQPTAPEERVAPQGRVALRLPPMPEQWIDKQSRVIENFGNADNLMIDGALAPFGGVIRHGPPLSQRFHDLWAFRKCLERAREYFAAKPGG